MDPPSMINRLSMVSNLALSINSSANFFVYVAGGTKFKKSFWRAQNSLKVKIRSMLDHSNKNVRRNMLDLTNKNVRRYLIEAYLHL